MYCLPLTISIDDREYAIRNNGDFRIVLECFEVLNDVELSEGERSLIALVIFYSDFNGIDDIIELQENDIKELIDKMFWFFKCGDDSGVVANTNYKTLDWKQDEQLICSAINKVASTEVRALPYLHWWTFMGYFSEIGESPLSTVVGIRTKIVKGKKLEKYEQEFQRENPQYFNWDCRTQQQKEDDELIKQLWNSKGGEVSG